MNYLHHYHAGNFADVWKHALLIPLIRALQRKEKGFLFLDTHAGRGVYDLHQSLQGDSLERKPEYPDGIGRLWSTSALPPALENYVDLVKRFDRERGNVSETPRFYPGSPRLAQLLLRPQDRLAACELHAAEFEALDIALGVEPNTSVHLLDGYTAIRAMLPPLEKRALVLIDPPFEAQDEFERILNALADAYRRLPAATIAVWYPLTARAASSDFLHEIEIARRAPALAVELTIAGESSLLKVRGCGLLIVNPPWQIETDLRPIVTALAPLLRQGYGAGGELRWLVKE